MRDKNPFSFHLQVLVIFYTTDKNKRNMPEKMEIKKFDPKVRKHVIFKEAKIK